MQWPRRQQHLCGYQGTQGHIPLILSSRHPHPHPHRQRGLDARAGGPGLEHRGCPHGRPCTSAMTTHPTRAMRTSTWVPGSLRTAACGHPPTDALLAAGAPGRPQHPAAVATATADALCALLSPYTGRGQPLSPSALTRLSAPFIHEPSSPGRRARTRTIRWVQTVERLSLATVQLG